jgi:integrase
VVRDLAAEHGACLRPVQLRRTEIDTGHVEQVLIPCGRPVRERLGTRPLQSITKSDVEDLVDWMLTAGRRRGGKPGTGLSGRSARLTLGRFSAALEAAVLEGKLVRNVARLVKPPEHTPRERETWSKAEVRKFLAKASSDRLYVAWRLSLYGLRRGEVLGLRWSDIDLRTKTLTVNQARVLVEYRVRIEGPKSRNGKRTLPLDGEPGRARQDSQDRLEL